MDDNSVGDFKTESSGVQENDLDLSIGNLLTDNGNSSGVLGRIDRYELVEKLGAGGFGAVYRAHDSVARVDVAVKVLPPMISAVPEELENVRSNFVLVSKLKHPNIASLEHLHKVEKVDASAQQHLRIFPGSYLVVMEYVDGSTLSNWKKQFPDRKVPLDQALDICGKVAWALDFAHGEGIIHRDVKPSNIMISPDGKVKVLDFGLAAEIRSSMGRVSKEQFDTSGTRPYMAPEQWAGESQDGTSDQYALACMLYELISGGVPFQSVFESGDTGLMLNLVENRMPKPLSELNKKQNAALLKALAKNGSERYASCDEFINAMGGKVKVKSSGKSSGWVKKVLFLVFLLIILAFSGVGIYYGYKKYRENQQAKAEQLIREKAAEEERQRQEQLAKETQDKLNFLKKKLETAFRNGNLSAASAAASEILSIDPQNSYARTMQDRIKEKAGLAETAPVKSRAEAAFERLGRISAEHGFQEKIDDLKLKLNTARTLFDAKSYGNALTKYQEVIIGCGKLMKLDSERNSALKSARRVEQERQSAEKSNAQSLAKSVWRNAKSLENDGKAKLDKGDFPGAQKSFIVAAKEYIHAKNYANGVSTFIIPKKQYETQLAKVKRTDLDKFGGENWTKARLAASQGDKAAAAENWDKALSSYRKAVTYITRAVKTTRSRVALEREKAIAREVYNESMKSARKYFFKALAAKNNVPSARKYCDAALKELRSVSTTYLDIASKNSLTKLAGEIENFKKNLWSGPGKGDNFKIPGLGMKFVYVSPGSFKMGSNDGDRDEKPVHLVTLNRGYWIGKYEVTQKEYQEFTGTNPSNFKGNNNPVECVSWDDAVKFCERLTERERKAGRLPEGYVYRLPTEAEWEYAARGGNKSRGYKYSGSNDLDRVGWYDSNSEKKAHGVGMKSPNELGIYDMSGNVWEWCNDWYGKSYYSSSPNTAPNGPSSGSYRVDRGGCWTYYAKYSRIAVRDRSSPDSTDYYLGFRVVLGPKLKESGYSKPVEPAQKRFPWDLIAVENAAYASLSGLAPGSRKAQEKQREYVEKTGLPLEVKARKTGIKLRLIPPGTFMMGSPDSETGRDKDETRRRVTLTKGFYLGVYEITQRQWEKVMGNKPAFFKNAGNDAPVEQVSWEDCQKFLAKLCELEGVPRGTYRLPSESEWEYACRAGTDTAFYSGNRLDSNMANCNDASKETGRRPVSAGSYMPNAYGLYDMHGNVWEWCSGWYGKYSPDGVAASIMSGSGATRVIRGGSWNHDAGYCRSANRVRYWPSRRINYLGLRILRTIPESNGQ